MRRSRTTLLTLLLLLLAGGLQARPKWEPKLHYGIEWGVAADMLNYHGTNFICCDGYRVNQSSMKLGMNINGDIKVFVGMDLNEKIQCDFCYGYAGVTQDRRISLFELKANYLPEGIMSDGLFYRASLGIGVPERVPFNAGILMNCGVGHRMMLSGRSSIDGICSFQSYLDHPWIMDVNGLTHVPMQNIRRNNALYLALHVSVVLNF